MLVTVAIVQHREEKNKQTVLLKDCYVFWQKEYEKNGNKELDFYTGFFKAAAANNSLKSPAASYYYYH